MAALGDAIAASAQVRPTIQTSINGVQTCTLSPDAGIAVLQQAITTRETIVARLPDVPVDALPGGANMVASLTRALQDSILADGDYEMWMRDFAAAGDPCGSDPNADASYASGQAASAQATADKEAFDSLWNRVASEYGQQPLSPTDY